MSDATDPAIDAAVDRALDAVAEALVDTPAHHRGALILELTAALVDIMLSQATDPAAAAALGPQRAGRAPRPGAAPRPSVLH
jgi:hypothetical protein